MSQLTYSNAVQASVKQPRKLLQQANISQYTETYNGSDNFRSLILRHQKHPEVYRRIVTDIIRDIIFNRNQRLEKINIFENVDLLAKQFYINEEQAIVLRVIHKNLKELPLRRLLEQFLLFLLEEKNYYYEQLIKEIKSLLKV